jgi:glycosyltransferase involved in cell wall biosynthesis
MKVLLIHQVFTPPTSPGGTRHYELARAAQSRGHEFTIIASDISYKTGERTVDGVRLSTRQDIDGIHVERAYTYPSLHQSFMWRVVAFLSFMTTSLIVGLRQPRSDIVMGTTPPIFQAVSTALIAAIWRVPFLLEVRDLWPEFAIDIGVLRNPLLIRLARWLESFLYARASHILVNSPAYRDYLLARGIAPAKISLVANGVDPDMFNPDADGSSVRARWAPNAKYIVTYAGAMGMANDLSTLLQAAAQLRAFPEIQFWLVGDGKDRPQLEALARELELTNVRFTGTIPKNELSAVFGASDACLATLKDIPMFRTTYPNKVFDYMAAGKPTVLAIDGVIRSVIEESEGGIFVPPGNPDALAATLLAMSRNPAAGVQMGRNARAYVVRHFNRHDQALQFVALLERLAARGD